MKASSESFASANVMNAEILKRWNERVSDADDVYILGDFSWDRNITRTMLQALHGKKHFINGNHDKGMAGYVGKPGGLVDIADYREIKDGDKFVVLSHYPMMSWNRAFHGSIHLYGHVHNSTDDFYMIESWMKAEEKAGKKNQMYNVGCMMPYMGYGPRTLAEIMATSEK